MQRHVLRRRLHSREEDHLDRPTRIHWPSGGVDGPDRLVALGRSWCGRQLPQPTSIAMLEEGALSV